MKRWIIKPPIISGAAILFLLIILAVVSDSGAVIPTPTISTQEPASSLTSNEDHYKWIKVLHSAEPFQVILIDKASQTLDVLEYDNGSITKLSSYLCATGTYVGKKSQSGDSKTPEGVYFITKSYSDNKVTIFGKRAFHLDYPNVFDRREERNGDGIYIHGTNTKLIPQSTNGCITVQNKDLDILAQFLIENKTPVVIVNDERELNTLPIELSEIQKDEILSQLLPEEVSQNDIFIHNLYIISNGEHYVVVGKLVLSSKKFPSTTFFRGYLNKDVHGNWLISKRVIRGPMVTVEPIAKKIRIATAPTAEAPIKVQSLVQKQLPAISDITTNEAILRFIEKWRQAWQNKELDDYIDCYADNFQQGRKNLQAWRKHKKKLNRRYKTISVEVDNIQIDLRKNRANVLFHQIYKSDKYFADGYKQLVLTHNDEKGWQILRESWRK